MIKNSKKIKFSLQWVWFSFWNFKNLEAFVVSIRRAIAYLLLTSGVVWWQISISNYDKSIFLLQRLDLAAWEDPYFLVGIGKTTYLIYLLKHLLVSIHILYANCPRQELLFCEKKNWFIWVSNLAKIAQVLKKLDKNQGLTL